MRKSLSGTKKAPHPELVEGRTALVQVFPAGTRFALVQMLQVQIGRLHRPGVTSGLVDGNAGRGELRIGECADGDRNHIRHRLQLPIDGRAAERTEMEGDGIAAVAEADERRRAAFDAGNLVTGEACLRAEDAARALLTGQTMADGNPDRLTFADEMQVSAAAGSPTGRHGSSPTCSFPRRDGGGAVRVSRSN